MNFISLGVMRGLQSLEGVTPGLKKKDPIFIRPIKLVSLIKAIQRVFLP